MTITKINNLSKLPQDCLDHITTYLEEKEKSNVAAAGRIFKKAIILPLFDRIIPVDFGDKIVPTHRLLSFHRQLANAIYLIKLPVRAVRARQIFQSPHFLSRLKVALGSHYCILSPDGENIITESDKSGDIGIYDIHTGRCKSTLVGEPGKITALAMTPDGKTLISGSLPEMIKIWDVKTLACKKSQKADSRGEYKGKLTKSNFEINSICTILNGKNFISKSARRAVQVWDTETGECIKTLHQGLVSVREDASKPPSLITPDEKNAIIYLGGHYAVLDIETGATKQTIPASSGFVRKIETTSDKKYFIELSNDEVETSKYTSKSNSIRIYDLEKNIIKATLKNCKHQHFYLTPNGKQIIVAFNDDTIKVYDIETATFCQTIPHEPDSIFTLSPNGLTLIIFGNTSIQIYDIASGAYQHHNIANSPPVELEPLDQINMAPDGNTFILNRRLITDIWTIYPLLENVITALTKAPPKDRDRFVLLDMIEYLEIIAERQNRPIQNLVPSAIEFTIKRIQTLSPEIQQEFSQQLKMDREETTTFEQNPVRSFLDRIDKLPPEMKDSFFPTLKDRLSNFSSEPA